MSEEMNWFNSSKEVKHFLNPFFCSIVLSEAIYSYSEEERGNMPLSLLLLVLPLALHKKTRNVLPRTKKTNLGLWANEHTNVTLGLDLRVASLSSFTFLAIGNLVINKMIAIEDERIVCLKRVDGIDVYVKTSEEIGEIMKSAALLGRWFANSSTPTSIYTYLGVSP